MHKQIQLCHQFLYFMVNTMNTMKLYKGIQQGTLGKLMFCKIQYSEKQSSFSIYFTELYIMYKV